MPLPSLLRAGKATSSASLILVLTSCGHGPELPSTTTPPSAAVKTTATPDRQPHTLALNASGTGKITSIKYTLDGRVVRPGAVDLPWREAVIVPADGSPHSWTLDVEFTGNGKVDLLAVFDGQVAAQGGSASSGSGDSSGDASVGGTVNG